MPDLATLSTVGGATISATNHISDNKMISATAKNHIGHNRIDQTHISHKIYGELIWHHNVHTSVIHV